MKTPFIVKTALWMIAGACFTSYAGWASPMLAPTLSEAVKSPIIVIASYQNCDLPKNGRVSFFGGVSAKYSVIRSLKGAYAPGKTISVNYVFQDNSGCIDLGDRHFSTEFMPKQGSRWILFLEYQHSGADRNYERSNTFDTYRGNFGRIAATGENIQKIESLIHPK